MFSSFHEETSSALGDLMAWYEHMTRVESVSKHPHFHSRFCVTRSCCHHVIALNVLLLGPFSGGLGVDNLEV
jgi:hypothetical protein